MEQLTLEEIESKAASLQEHIQELIPPIRSTIYVKDSSLKAFLRRNHIKPLNLNEFETIKRTEVGKDRCQSLRSLYVRAIASGMDPASRSSVAQKRFGYRILKDGQTILEDAMASQSYHKVTEWIMAGRQRNHQRTMASDQRNYQTRRIPSSEPARKVSRQRI